MQRRTVLAAGAVMGLGACGFRLRASQRAPQLPLLVRGEIGATTLALIARLRADGQAVWLSGDPKAPPSVDAVLVVAQDHRQRVVLGASASGLVRELSLRLHFRWSLLDANDKERIAPQDFSVEQDMSFNESAALGKSEEEAALFQALQERAVRNTIARLARLAR